MGSFFKENLIDELFLTITPKIVGNEPGKTLTMAEGYLYPPDQVPTLDLVSCQQVDNELYLRYRTTTKR
jgi:riboflavin biosynthesis pyrimidine reductase